MILGLFRRRGARLAPVDALFARLAEASRQPALYLRAGIPDSFEGRFDSLTLHAFLLLRRLRELPPPAAELAQDLVDACFAYLELGFRNGGISDIAVPKRMKKIGRSFFGRLQAYEAALASDDPQALVEALGRNAAPGEGEAVVLADYVRRAQAALAGRDLDMILTDGHLFPILSEEESGHAA